ncbi:MAG: anthranilate synthase component I [Halobacteria archaeon]
MSRDDYFDVNRDEFSELVGEDRIVRLERELNLDVSPLEVYSALGSGYSFLLESAEIDVSAFRQVEDGNGAFTGARYSYVGFDPEGVLRLEDREVEYQDLSTGEVRRNWGDVVVDGEVQEGYDSLDAVRATFPDREVVNPSEEDSYLGGYVGFLAYDVVNDVWLNRESPGERKDAVFVLSNSTVVFDHSSGSVKAVLTPTVSGDSRNRYDELVKRVREVENTVEDYSLEDSIDEEFELIDARSGDRAEYMHAVEETREHIIDGDIYQAVISRERRVECRGDPREFYSKLRDVNPSPYMFLLDFDGFSVVGSSPETLLGVHGGEVTTNPIAGTCPRGETAVEDRRLAGEMLSDEKELSEHVMLVDLGRNDVRRVADSGTVTVDDFMSVVQYSHVQHIESTVSGDLRGGKDAFDATRSIFPAGTLSGAPKLRAMKIIDDLEPSPRGVYGGGVGYYSYGENGIDCDLAIAIRTATFEELGDTRELSVRAGAGVVADSVPESEFEETEKKMDALIQTLEQLTEEQEEASGTSDGSVTEAQGSSEGGED